jgi:8-oxo-dGTP pyrophosphatase MutT (NUDIX family)
LVARIAQAGAIVVDTTGPEPRFLLVKAKRDPTVWIFPKGHVERGETVEETALRETAEEAGITGRILAPVGSLEFISDGRPLHVDYFLVERTGVARFSEKRQSAWGTYEETHDRLIYANARELLARANRLVEKFSS